MSPARSIPRATLTAVAGLVALGVTIWTVLPRRSGDSAARGSGASSALAGSESCRGCHEAFFQKWKSSFHGLAMRPYTPAFARERLQPQATGIAVQGRSYRAVIGTAEDHVEETGPDGTIRYPIVQALGGKNVFYFLTRRERGFLQTLPVAYDVRRREWFSTTASAVRHLEGVTDDALPWTDRAYTFNTSCFSCHVSQLSTNYEPASDSYRTAWAEPGINCETCHGPADDHVKLCQTAARGAQIGDPKLVSFARLTHEQRNDLCASCHAKTSPLGTDFRPGGRFFDHFDLVTLESPDYYPDGRDLGENYTLSSWRMSPCVRSAPLDCLHCHTSSGRYRWKDDPNGACRSCHAARAGDVAAHAHHRADGPGGVCTACHMPTTEFARMRRSDHSMRPPAPAATIAFGSPNACNLCHTDRDARWAERTLRAWRRGIARASEARLLREGRLVAAARAGDWSQLPAIVSYLQGPERDEVVTTSLARLLGNCGDPAKGPALRRLAVDRSPLVRAAAVFALADDPGSLDLLVMATRDESRLVRLRAADSLAGRDLTSLPESERRSVAAADAELVRSLEARPDQSGSHYALGNLALERGASAEAVAHYRKALALRADDVASLVNLSLAYARLGQLVEAEEPLRRAVAVEPRSPVAHYNLGLLLAERGNPREAEAELRRALELNPRLAGAAYNLSLLIGKQDLRQARDLARRAAEVEPDQPRYAWTLAYYAVEAGDLAGARSVLERLVRRHPGHADGWSLLGSVLERQGRRADARRVYVRAAATTELSPADRAGFERRAGLLTRR